MKIEEGKVVALEFKVYDNNNNELLEDTKEVGQFFFIQGFGNFVPKIEEILKGKEAGYKGEIVLTPDEGYGDRDEEMIFEMEKSQFSEFEDIYVGLDFIADLEDGEEQSFVIKEILGDKVIADGNHPFSGKEIRFEIEVKEVREATEEELETGEPLFEKYN